MTKWIICVCMCLGWFGSLQSQPTFRLYITKVEVAEKKADGKHWDTLQGKPDIKIVVDTLDGKVWKKATVSEVKKDDFVFDQLWNTGVDIQPDSLLRFTVLDQDISRDDEIGRCIEHITSNQVNLCYEKNMVFSGVKKFRYFISSSTDTKVALEEVQQQKEKALFLGSWLGNSGNIMPHVSIFAKEGKLQGNLKLNEEQNKHSIEIQFADNTISWTMTDNEEVICSFSGALDETKQKIAGKIKVVDVEEEITFEKNNRQYIFIESNMVTLESFEITPKHTIIHFVVLKNTPLGIYPAGHPKALFLLDPNTDKKYKLLTFEGINAAPNYGFTKKFTCYFERLDDNVRRFYCIEAEHEVRQAAKDENFWLWKDIPIDR